MGTEAFNDFSERYLSETGSGTNRGIAILNCFGERDSRVGFDPLAERRQPGPAGRFGNFMKLQPACDADQHAIGKARPVSNKKRRVAEHSFQFVMAIDLKRDNPTVSHRMLTLELRKLEDAGIVRRTAHDGYPLRVDYDLTMPGIALVPLIDALGDWWVEMKPIEGNRTKLSNAA